jgi:hypothetical protein
VEVDRLKQRLVQQPSARMEQELQQRIESLQADNCRLMESIDTVRANAETEKQQQVSKSYHSLILLCQPFFKKFYGTFFSSVS